MDNYSLFYSYVRNVNTKPFIFKKIKFCELIIAPKKLVC